MSKRIQLIPLVTACIAASWAVNAAAAESSVLSVGAGAIAYSTLKTAGTPEGNAKTFGEVYPTLSLGWRIDSFDVTAAYTVFGKTAQDDAATKKILFTSVTYALLKDDSFRLRAGTGLLFYSIAGKGGSVTLQNGGSTSTFYRPSETKTSRLFHLNAGSDYRLTEEIKVHGDLILVGPLTEKRTLSLFVGLTYAVL